MTRLRNTLRTWRVGWSSRSSLLAAPILAAVTGGLLAAATALPGSAARAAAPDGEWFRAEPPRSPADPSGAPANAAEPSDLGAAPAAPAAPATAGSTPAAADAPPPAAPPAPAAPAVGPAPAAPAETPRRPAFPGNVPGPYSGLGGLGYNDYPSSDVYNYVIARTRAITAQAMFRRAESELTIAFRDARRAFETSQAYQDAVREERVAYDELNNTRRKSLRSLADDMKYQHLALLRQDLTEQIARRRAAHNISQEEVLAMATLKMNYATDMRAMEAQVIAGDGGQVKAAQDRLVAAGSRLATLRAKYDESLRTSPEILAARRNLEDAKLVRLIADANLTGSAYATDQALEYAYFLHRSRPVVANQYGYGYNWGDGYGLRY